MNIVAFDKSTSSRGGGAEMSNFQVLTRLGERGHRILLCYERAGDYLPRYEALGIATMPLAHTYLKREGGATGTARGAALLARDALRLARAVRRAKADVLYWNVVQALPVGVLAARLTGRPLVGHVRTVQEPSLSRQFRTGLGAAAAILANSDATARSVRALCPGATVATVYNGIDLRDFAPAPLRPTRGPLRVLYVGRIAPEKGVHVLLEALAIFAAQSGLDVECSICGEAPANRRPYADDLRRTAASLPFTVDFLGHRTDTAAVISAADVVVVPSVCPEAFGRVIVEAMACGRPVVASRTGGIPEVMGPGLSRYLAAPDDAGDLACAIARLAADRAAAAIPTTLLRARAETFSLGATVRGVEARLEEAAARQRGRASVRSPSPQET